MSPTFDAKAWLGQITADMREAYARNRRVMSFGEYLTLFEIDMPRQVRSAAQYLRDVFDRYGTTTVRGPRGALTHWQLFDCPWDQGRDSLKGQEEVQAAVYRLLSNFARQGRSNRLILLHGPNGSAKSTFVSCLQRAMEHYSSLDEGALYRFNWIFPSQRSGKGGIGFGGGLPPESRAAGESYAYLEDDLVEAKIVDELRDHPILLLPRAERRAWIEGKLKDQITAGLRPALALLDGDLSHRNRQIFDALLVSYQGDLAKVLRHVQVERFFISRRYRQSLATVEPQLAVDARVRPLTMDRSLATLPPALQSLTLFEFCGELVDGNRGLLDFDDLLKRPLDAFKYLLGVVEDGMTSLEVASIAVDTVFLATANESYLAAFKESPEFQSFKGRMELVRAPYLLDHRLEQQIYDARMGEAMGAHSDRHVAPHVTWVAALWAVLTRMRKPSPEKYPEGLADLVARLGPGDKARLYADEALESFSPEEQQQLLAGVELIARESDSYPHYEGRSGASPREMTLLLMNAAQSAKWKCVSPFAVLEELEELVRAVSVYEFLRQEPMPGGFHDNGQFITQVHDRLIERIDDEVRTSMGLVDERRYLKQFERYLTQVSCWVKHEKHHNPVTGQDEDADEDLMAEVERALHVEAGDGGAAAFRREIIAKIGAWSLDHRDQRPDYEQIFPRPLAELREAFFAERRKVVRKINEDILIYLVDGPSRMAPDAAAASRRTLDTLQTRFGYCEHCAKDAVLALVRSRYS
jgi:predicted Ser/Thr protein kinase